MATEKRIKIVIDNREAKRKIDETDDSMRGLGKTSDGTTNTLRTLSKVATAVISAVAIQRVVAYADKFSELQTQLKLVTDSTRELNNTTQTLLELSNSTASSLDGTVGIYTKLTRATEQLGSSQEEILDVTRAINQSFVISGASAEEASNAIRQLNQGLASGVLRGEEFNAINENADRLARALADSLGVTRGELRELAKQGVLTTEVVFEALKGQASSINEEFQQVDLTVGRAFSNLNDAATVSVGRLDQATGASGRLAQAIDGVADSINSIDPSAFEIAGEVAATTGEMNALLSPLGIAAQEFGLILDALEDIGGSDSLATLNNSLKETVRLSGELSKLTGLPALTGGQLVAPPQTVGVERDPQNQEFMGTNEIEGISRNEKGEGVAKGEAAAVLLRQEAAAKAAQSREAEEARQAQAREELQRQNQQAISEQFLMSEQQRTEMLKAQNDARENIQQAYNENRLDADAKFYEVARARSNIAETQAIERLNLEEEREAARFEERRAKIVESVYLDNEARSAAMQEVRQQELEKEREFQLRKDQIEQNAAERRIRIKQMEEQAKISATKGAFSDIAGLMQSGSKTLFKIGQGAAIANATISAYEAINKTMTTIPYPYNIPLAAAQGVAAFANVRSIAQQQPNGSGGGGSPQSAAGGGGASAMPQMTRQQEPPTQTSTFEFKGFSELSQKLAQFDPNDPLPAEVAQRIAAGIEKIRTLEGGTA